MELENPPNPIYENLHAPMPQASNSPPIEPIQTSSPPFNTSQTIQDHNTNPVIFESATGVATLQSESTNLHQNQPTSNFRVPNPISSQISTQPDTTNPQYSRETISTGQVSNIRKNFEFWGAKKGSEKRSGSVKSITSKLHSPMTHPTSFGFMPKSQSTTNLPEGLSNQIHTPTDSLPGIGFGGLNQGFETRILETQALEETAFEHVNNDLVTPSGMPVQPQYIDINQETRATPPTLQNTLPTSHFGSNSHLNQSLENTITTGNTNTNTES